MVKPELGSTLTAYVISAQGPIASKFSWIHMRQSM